MEVQLRNRLVTTGTVTALVPAASIVWGQRVGLPAIALHRVSGVPEYDMDGPVNLVSSLAQVDCWASTFASVQAIAKAVKDCLSGYRDGTLRGVFIANERSTFEAGEGASGSTTPSNFHRVSLDIRVMHSPG